MDSLAKPPEGDAPLRYEDLHVAGAGRQLSVLLGRNFRQYTRALAYNGTRVIITIVISICFGTLFINKVGPGRAIPCAYLSFDRTLDGGSAPSIFRSCMLDGVSVWLSAPTGARNSTGASASRGP